MHSQPYRVVWESTFIEANSPADAALQAFKKQKAQQASAARYTVIAEDRTFEDVMVSDLAPIETLTDREREVAYLVMKGATNADIAQTLTITPRTVKAHVSHIFDKFNVNSRVKLAMKMYKMHQAGDGNVTC